MCLLCHSLNAVPFGNYGCSGGTVGKAFQYIISNDGINSQSSYPYVGRVSIANVSSSIMVMILSQSCEKERAEEGERGKEREAEPKREREREREREKV